jgi:hypothetical protein
MLFVHCSCAGDHLIEGESVSVETLDLGSMLLNLRVLDGQYSGYTLKEGDGSVSAGLAMALGLFLLFASRAKWRHDPEDLSEDNLNMPKEGVDAKSMLDLSPHDE